MFCALVFGSGLASIPVFDRDEARIAQTTFQMLESGDYWRIAFQDTPRTDIPHAVHWLQAAAVAAFSSADAKAIWAYRLPSALGAWVTVLFAYLLGRDLFGRRAGLTAAMLLAVSPVLIAEAHIATADGALVATMTAAHWVLARAYLAGHGGPRPGGALAALFWVMVAAAALLKAPVGPAVIAATAVALCLIDRRVMWLRPLWRVTGALAVAALVAAWTWRAAQAHDAGLVEAILAADLLPRLYTGAQGAPPGTHVLLALVALGPAVPFVLLALAGVARNRTMPELRFCLAWLAPAWIVLELTATKLPHYALPLFPALTLLAAWRLGREDLAGCSAERVTIALWGALSASIFFAVIGYLALPAWQPGLASADVLAIALISLSTSLAAIYFGAAGRPRAVAWLAITSVAAIAVCGAAFALPRIEFFWMTERIVEAIERHAGDRAAGLVAVGYHEPSLVFRTATDTALVDEYEAAELAAGDRPLVFVVDERARAGFEQRTLLLGGARLPGAAVSGFNYSSGRWLTVWLYFP